MDGNFVTNMGYGTSYVKHMRDVTDIPLDIHLMITNPEYKLEWFDLQPTDIVSIHAESTQDIKGAIEAVKSYGCKCTVAINPITPIDVLEEVYTMADGVNILHVTPGFAGQKAVEGTVEKQGREKKVVTFKYKPKKHQHTKQGHRQPYTKVVIDAINA